MNESLTHEQLSVLKRAREILEETYCAWWTTHPDGVHHCAMGAVERASETSYWEAPPDIWPALDLTSWALHPELRGRLGIRLENGTHCDNFEHAPTVFVNNQLGKEAILQVFDTAILEAEIRLASAPMPEPEPDEQDEKAAVLVAG